MKKFFTYVSCAILGFILGLPLGYVLVLLTGWFWYNNEVLFFLSGPFGMIAGIIIAKRNIEFFTRHYKKLLFAAIILSLTLALIYFGVLWYISYMFKTGQWRK